MMGDHFRVITGAILFCYIPGIVASNIGSSRGWMQARYLPTLNFWKKEIRN
jgi:hypothetical protein